MSCIRIQRLKFKETEEVEFVGQGVDKVKLHKMNFQKNIFRVVL